MKETSEWFKEWFNSSYYHLLYNQRNDAEAALFIQNLAKKLGFKKNKSALDIACGSGRHALQISELGLHVDAFDLSKNSIETAKKMEQKNLHFYVHDMRKVFKANAYDYVFNLFTSFGYLSNIADEKTAFAAICTNVKPGGLLILDFLNSSFIEQNLVTESVEKRGEIVFDIKRFIENETVIKQINFEDNNTTFNIEERVRLIADTDFKILLETNGMKLLDEFGDYQLNAYSKNQSNRYIFVAERLHA